MERDRTRSRTERHGRSRLIAALTVGAVVAPAVCAAPATATPHASAAPATATPRTAGDRIAAIRTDRGTQTQLYYWRWSDGSEHKQRTFRRATYRVPERLPRLIVSAYPATPARSVTLQYRDGPSWRLEDSGRLNAAGSVALTLNPYCPDGTWCEGTFDYRAVVDGRTTSFRITFVR